MHRPIERLAALGLAAALVLTTACSGGEEGVEPAEALTRAQKDSIVADLPIPGASGVGGALEARDRANARAAQLDSARN